MNYTVTLQLSVDAESYNDAARQVDAMLRDPAHPGWVLEVKPERGGNVYVDTENFTVISISSV